MIRVALWALPLALASASCLPRKPPRRYDPVYDARDRAYTVPEPRAREPSPRPRLSGAQVTGTARSTPPPRELVPPTTPAASVSYDEFTGRTRVIVRDQMPPHMFDVVLITSLPGAADHGGLLTFRHYSESWEYLRCHHVAMLVDGAIVQLPDSEHDGRTQRGGVTEDVSVRISADVLRALLSASEVRVRVCNDDWTFTPRMMTGFADIRERIFPTAPDPADPALWQPPDEPSSEVERP